MRRIRGIFIDFLRQDSGVTAIEFALIAPVFFLVLMAIFEFALLYFTDGALRNALKDVAYGLAQECDANLKDGNGACPANSNPFYTFAGIEQQIRAYTINLVEVNRLCMYAQPIEAHVTGGIQINQGHGNGWNIGVSEDIVRYDFRYRWGFFTDLIGIFFPNHELIFQATYLVRNGSFGNEAARQMGQPGYDASCAF